MKRPNSALQKAAAAFVSRGRSELYDWLAENFDRLPRYEKYRVNWPGLTEVLSDDFGIKGRNGQPLRPDAVRKVYLRVLAERERQPPPGGSSAAPASAPLSPDPSAQPSPPPSRATPMQPAEVPLADPYTDEKPRFHSGATLRSRMPRSSDGDNDGKET
jgi:hypothetical protein